MYTRVIKSLTSVACLLFFTTILATSAFANGYEQFPGPICWSADSSMFAVAYPSDFNGFTYFGELVVYDKYGRVKFDLGTDFSSPSFSPDGRKLAVVLQGDVVVFELEDTKEARHAGLTDALDCSWAMLPGGEKLLVSYGERFGDADVFALDADLGGESQLIDVVDVACVGPVASPEGKFVAFTRQPGDDGLYGYERIWLLDTTSGEVTRSSPEHAREWDYHESNPVWADDETMLFQRGGWGDWHLYRRNVVTGREYLELTDAQQPSLSADARWLGFTRRDYEVKKDHEYDWEIPPAVWLMDRESKLVYRTSEPGQTAQHPAVSPDGKYCAWLETNELGEIKVKLKRTFTIAHP